MWEICIRDEVGILSTCSESCVLSNLGILIFRETICMALSHVISGCAIDNHGLSLGGIISSSFFSSGKLDSGGYYSSASRAVAFSYDGQYAVVPCFDYPLL